jgi:predicted RNA binding protein YcfA (HicA-like mRNA interferase family)
LSDRLTPCSRTEFIRKLRALGYEGPFAGGKHEYVAAEGRRPITVPNPHRGDIGIVLLQRILRDAGIDRDKWLAA